MERNPSAPVHSEAFDVAMEGTMALADPGRWRHLSITVTAEQRDAFAAEASRQGQSNRALAQNILLAWLRKPTLVQPVTKARGRVRIRVNISERVHARLSAYASEHNIPMTAIAYTAIARHLNN